MNKLKRCGIIFLSCMTLSTATTTVFTANTIIAEAHSGRTDANGGHRDNKNKSGLGSYHYHCNGHPAHLHTNGVCPYAVGGQTDNSSAGNSSTAAAEAPSITYDLMNSYSRVFDPDYYYNRNLLGGLYRENPVKSRNYEAVKSSKKWENVGNSYIIPALLLYRYSYI